MDFVGRRFETIMAKRKKFFTTKKEATAYKKTYVRKTVMEPEREQLEVFKFGKRFFLGTGVEFDFVRFS